MVQESTAVHAEINNVLCAEDVGALKVLIMSRVMNISCCMYHCVNIGAKFFVCLFVKSEVFLFNIARNGLVLHHLVTTGEVEFQDRFKFLRIADKTDDVHFIKEKLSENM